MTEKTRENVDLQWIARHVAALQGEVRALRYVGDAAIKQREIRDLGEDIRSIRDHIDVTASGGAQSDRNTRRRAPNLRSYPRSAFAPRRALGWE